MDYSPKCLKGLDTTEAAEQAHMCGLNETYFLTVLEAESPGSEYQHSQIPVRPLLAFRWLSSHCFSHG